MAGFGDTYHGKLPNKNSMENQTDHFWSEIHKLIYTILQ